MNQRTAILGAFAFTANSVRIDKTNRGNSLEKEVYIQKIRETKSHYFSFLFYTALTFYTQPLIFALDQPISSQVIQTPSTIQAPIQSFESVEIERLKMVKEASKVAAEETEFNAEVAKLHKKLLDASAAAYTPAYTASDYSTFINASAKEVGHSEQYYKKIQDVLNQLTSKSPYLSRTSYDNVNPERASHILSELMEYGEDDGISRTILDQWSAKEGGQRDDYARIAQINKSIADLSDQEKKLEWNLRIGSKPNLINGQPISGTVERASLSEDIARVKAEIEALVTERSSVKDVVAIPLRKLEFQQFIVSLAAQERNVHALIACAVYRNVFLGGDMSISQKAYPSGADVQKGPPTLPTQGTIPMPENASAPTMPVINTVTGLESFLLNRIHDAKVDRESLENMMSTKHLSAAESLLRKMVLTAKYQPELQTFSYENRQKIQNFSQTIRRLSEALDSKNYPEVDSQCKMLEQQTSDVNISDLKAFAKENNEKSLLWVKMASVSAAAGDVASSESLLEAARRRSPNNKEVQASISEVQDKISNAGQNMKQLDEVIKNGDYLQAFDKMNEYFPLVAVKGDPSLKTQFNNLIDEEKTVRAAIEKSTALKKMNDPADAWMELEGLDEPMKNDKRVLEKKTKLVADASNFISAYEKAKQFSSQGKNNLSLYFYLQAQSNAPNSEIIKERIKITASQILNGF